MKILARYATQYKYIMKYIFKEIGLVKHFFLLKGCF